MRHFTSAALLALLSATVSQPVFGQQTAAPTLLQQLDESFSSAASSCLGERFRPKRLKEQVIQGRKIRTAIPDDILAWDPIEDHLFQSAAFYDDRAFDLEFSKVFEVRDDGLFELGEPLEVFWDKIERPLMSLWTDTVVREHNCITLVRGTSSLGVNVGFLSAAAEASIDSQRATTTFTYAGRILSPYAWAVGGLPIDQSNVRPTRPRVDFLLRMWSWYRDNSQHAGKRLAINADLTGIAMFTVKELTQQAMLETTADAGLGFGPFSASAEGTAGLQRRLQSKIDDFTSAVLNRYATAHFPSPLQLAELIRNEIRLSGSADNPASIGGGSVRYVASLPSMTERLCVQSAWADATTGTLPTADFRVERRPDGTCQFSVLLTPPPDPSDNLTLAFAVESAIENDSAPAKLRFSLPIETLSDSRLLISFDLRPLSGLSLKAEDVVHAREHAITFQVIEKGGARLGDIDRGATFARIKCGNLPERPLQLLSITTEAGGNGKLVRMVTSLEASLLNAIEPGSTAECVISATIEASRTGPGPSSQRFTLPSARFVIKKDAIPAPTPEAA